MSRSDEVESMNGIGVLLTLAGMVIDLVALAASSSQRVRMALPLPVDSSPTVLFIIGLVSSAVGCLMLVLNNS